MVRCLKKSMQDWVGRVGEERTRRVTFGFRLKRSDGFDWSFLTVDVLRWVVILVAVCLSEIGSGEGVWLCVVMLKSRESLAEDIVLICLFMVVSTEETRFSLLKIQTILSSVVTSVIFGYLLMVHGPREQVG